MSRWLLWGEGCEYKSLFVFIGFGNGGWLVGWVVSGVGIRRCMRIWCIVDVRIFEWFYLALSLSMPVSRGVCVCVRVSSE